MTGVKIGFAMCASFCTFSKSLAIMKDLIAEGAEIIPIMSLNAANTDTRFGKADEIKGRITELCGREIIESIEGAEPIGPKKMCDLMLVAPCTGNTLAKLACGITDTPVTMAVKSHLRTERPVVLAVATNDALSASARNIGELLNRKHYYFAPLCQDDPVSKPRSVVFAEETIVPTVREALAGRQLQPILRGA